MYIRTCCTSHRETDPLCPYWWTHAHGDDRIYPELSYTHIHTHCITQTTIFSVAPKCYPKGGGGGLKIKEHSPLKINLWFEFQRQINSKV